MKPIEIGASAYSIYSASQQADEKACHMTLEELGLLN
jgi:hypothetical protein